MKELLLPMLFDNGQSIRDGEEIGRLGAQARNLSRQLANQQASADSLREALTYSQRAAQTYSELAESYQRQRDRLQKKYDELFEDPYGLQAWVQFSLLDMRSRLVRSMISKERLLAMEEEEGITAPERREMNKALVSFAYVLWKGMTRFMQLYVEAQESLQVLRDRVGSGETIPEDELGRVLHDAVQNMVVAQDIRLPSWPGLGWNPSGTKRTLRERTVQAQQALKTEMEGDGVFKGGKVIFEPNGNRLIPGPVSTPWKGGIRTMLEEDWAYIMDKQFE